MAGKRQKHPDDLIERQAGRVKALAVLPVVPFQAPDPPETLGEAGKAAWAAFWQSPLANAVDQAADLERLRHWARCIDQVDRLWPAYQGSPLLKARTGELVTNPLYRQIRGLSDEIDRIGETFGMSPLWRLRLGVTYLQGRAIAEELAKPPRERGPIPMEQALRLVKK